MKKRTERKQECWKKNMTAWEGGEKLRGVVQRPRVSTCCWPNGLWLSASVDRRGRPEVITNDVISEPGFSASRLPYAAQNRITITALTNTSKNSSGRANCLTLTNRVAMATGRKHLWKQSDPTPPSTVHSGRFNGSCWLTRRLDWVAVDLWCPNSLSVLPLLSCHSLPGPGSGIWAHYVTNWLLKPWLIYLSAETNTLCVL